MLPTYVKTSAFVKTPADKPVGRRGAWHDKGVLGLCMTRRLKIVEEKFDNNN